MSSTNRAEVRAAAIASHVAASSSSLSSHSLVMRPTNVIVAGEPAKKPKKNYLDLENAENVYVSYLKYMHFYTLTQINALTCVAVNYHPTLLFFFMSECNLKFNLL